MSEDEGSEGESSSEPKDEDVRPEEDASETSASEDAVERDEPAAEDASADDDKDEGVGDEAAADQPLAETLLRAPVEEEGGRWAYPLWLTVLVSVFVLYHGLVLLVHNTPNKGLSKKLHVEFNKRLKMRTYMQTTGNTQSWAMFAPNPHRSNIFMKVLVKDQRGEVWDLGHDIYGKRTYPYTFYDRLGKINRRIVDQKGYRRPYAAWVCRWWEQRHEGESAEEVQFIKMWTRIPPPDKVIRKAKGDIRRMWFDPMKLHLHQREEDTFRCKTTRHAQLPDYLRERYGLPPAPKNHFRPVHLRTWWDKKKTADSRQKHTAVDVRSGSGK